MVYIFWPRGRPKSHIWDWPSISSSYLSGYEFLHKGGCLVKNGNNGWDEVKITNETSTDACFETCFIRGYFEGKRRGYFGFAPKNHGTEGSCVCFLDESICEPGTKLNVDVYRIDWERLEMEGMFNF